MILVPATTITAAITGTVLSAASVPVPNHCHRLLVEASFTYGSGGTTAKFYVQTRVAGGTWRDIIQLAFTTASAKKWSSVHAYAAVAAAIAVSDGALADDTILNGFIGTELRVKGTTTGTYAGGTSITILATAAE